MGRRGVSDDIRASIIQLSRTEKLRPSEIAKRLKLSRCCVANTLERYEQSGDYRQRAGGKRASSYRDTVSESAKNCANSSSVTSDRSNAETPVGTNVAGSDACPAGPTDTELEVAREPSSAFAEECNAGAAVASVSATQSDGYLSDAIVIVTDVNAVLDNSDHHSAAAEPLGTL